MFISKPFFYEWILFIFSLMTGLTGFLFFYVHHSPEESDET